MSGCLYEIDVVAAARQGRWTQALRDHAAGCIVCAETALVVAALADDVEGLLEETTPLPDPRAIWIRSRMEVRHKRSTQALRVIAWTQRATVAIAVTVGLFFAPGLQTAAANILGAFPMPRLSDLPILISGPAAVVGITFVVMGVMAFWSEHSGVEGLR